MHRARDAATTVARVGWVWRERLVVSIDELVESILRLSDEYDKKTLEKMRESLIKTHNQVLGQQV